MECILNRWRKLNVYSQAFNNSLEIKIANNSERWYGNLVGFSCNKVSTPIFKFVIIETVEQWSFLLEQIILTMNTFYKITFIHREWLRGSRRFFFLREPFNTQVSYLSFLKKLAPQFSWFNYNYFKQEALKKF